MKKESKQVNRSIKRIKNQIESHNLNVQRSAFCPVCHLVNGRPEEKKAERA